MFGVVWLVPVINTLTKHCLGLTNSQRLTLNLKKLVSLATFKLKTTHNATPVVPLYLFVCWFDSRHEHPVAIDELHEGVADWISCTADPNGLHHPRVPQLTHTKLPVKQLQAQTQQLSLKFLVQVLITSSKVRWYLRNSKWSLITCWNNLKKKVLHDVGYKVKLLKGSEIWTCGWKFLYFQFLLSSDQSSTLTHSRGWSTVSSLCFSTS